MSITIKFGVEEYKLESNQTPTIGNLKENGTLRAYFGWGDNLRALIDGVEQPNNLLVQDGSTVRMETACNSKAKGKRATRKSS